MATTESVLTGLEPRSFWGHFEALTRIARPSRHEEPAIEHVREWADRQGFELEQDAGRNLVVRVPATPGRESAPTVVLQGHLDIVCERDPSSPNDPAEGRIELVRDGEWLTADGTTLGADDGVAIAAMMALVEDESLPHGPLELLMTVAEEVGARGRERARPRARDGLDPDQPRQRGGREADGGVRRQHRYLDPDRGAARAGRRRCGDACRHGERRSGRSLRDGNLAGTVERGQGAWAGAARGADDGALPARLPLRRQEPQRDPARRDRGLLGRSGASEQAFRAAIAAAAETIRDAFAKTDAGVSVDVAAAEASAQTRGPTPARPRCSMPSLSCRPDRSR